MWVHRENRNKSKSIRRKENGKKNKDGCIFLFSHADLRVVERNETHATLQCETDLHQIIFKITKNGKTRRFEAKRYERNGNFVTAETSILVNETVNVICNAKTLSRNETDRLTLHPYEGLWSLNTIYLHIVEHIRLSALEGNECLTVRCIQCVLY